MIPPKHFIVYDAQTYERDGFIQVAGRVQQLAAKPRFGGRCDLPETQDPATGEVQKKHFKFRTQDRFRLSELAPIVNNEIHKDDDYLPDCISVMVKATVLL